MISTQMKNFSNESTADTKYTLRPATIEDAYEIWSVMNLSCQAMTQKDHFICDDLNYVKDILAGHGFGVAACDFDEKIVGNLLVKYPGVDEENLGYDVFVNSDKKNSQNTSPFFDTNILSVTSSRSETSSKYLIPLTMENLRSVVHMDSASVLPEHRGYHLESRMIAYAETLIDTSKYHYSFATVAPENLASLKSLERNGYQVMIIKEKYGGLMRCVMMKELT